MGLLLIHVASSCCAAHLQLLQYEISLLQDLPSTMHLYDAVQQHHPILLLVEQSLKLSLCPGSLALMIICSSPPHWNLEAIVLGCCLGCLAKILLSCLSILAQKTVPGKEQLSHSNHHMSSHSCETFEVKEDFAHNRNHLQNCKNAKNAKCNWAVKKTTHLPNQKEPTIHNLRVSNYGICNLWNLAKQKCKKGIHLNHYA